MTSDGSPVLIVGAGLSGLACAQELNRQGIACTLFEASGRVGGRIGSETFQGFILDRGFQVFLEAYPEARRVLDYAALQLRQFEPGAIVHWHGQQFPLVDPRRRRAAALRTALSPLATWRDKFGVLRLVRQLITGNTPVNQRTIDRLQHVPFGPTIIEHFFRPFFGGVFLDSSLDTSSRMFDFTFKLFATGDTSLPARGMQAIPDQLASRLIQTHIELNQQIERIEGTSLVLHDGQRVSGSAVVIATDASTAAQLLPWVDIPRAKHWAGATCVYFSAPRSPLTSRLLVLNGDGPFDGPINHVCVPSDVSHEYAPCGRVLISCSAIGFDHSDIERRAIDQLRNWFGPQVDRWQHLKTYHIPHALPDQSIAAYEQIERPPRIGPNQYVCGDHCDFASINGALISGRRAAEAIVQDRRD